MPYLKLDSRPTDLATQQAAAAVGQNVLIYRYQDSLDRFDIVAGQVLLDGRRSRESDAPQQRAARDGAAARPAHPADRQRERHRRDPRDPLRRQRPARGHGQRAGRRRPAGAAERRRCPLHPAAARARGPSRSRTCHSATTSRASSWATIGAAGVGTGGAGTKIAAAKLAAASGTPVLLASTGNVAAALAGEVTGTWFESRCSAGLSRRVPLPVRFLASPAAPAAPRARARARPGRTPAGNPTSPISAPTAGATIAAPTNWPVFCAPSARPDQCGPANSATAVKARPLSATLMQLAST